MKNYPLILNEIEGRKDFQLSPEEKSWLAERNVVLILPLRSRSRLVGFIGLGHKTEREDFNAEECGILMTLASQVAVAGENLQLLEENIEKNRMERELGMARDVQRGLLPGAIPPTPGLEIAANSRFCLEVAGDYYDIINIDSDHTVLAIGDVSGKGAAAALMMSNIQASFRTAIGIEAGGDKGTTGNHLSAIIGQINDLIHRNTPPGQFITFFVAIYKNSAKTITYVNAGHNPPLLMRPSGEIITLDQGGLLLGALPNMPYAQDTVRLEVGDIMFLYTDGVSEAENAAGEMFEESRIKELLLKHRGRPAGEILSTLESEVQSFIGEVPLADDFTTLVARVK